MRNLLIGSIAIAISLHALLGAGCSNSSGGGGGSRNSENTTVSETIIMAASSNTSPSVASSTHSDTMYFTPFNFTTILQDSYTPSSLTTATSFTARHRYLLRSSGGGYLTVNNINYSATSTTAVSTYSDTLAKIFEVHADANNAQWFKIDSELHGIYSLDTDTSGNLYFADNRGVSNSPASRGYVVFTYDATTHLLQAKARYSYDLSTHTHASTADGTFSQTDYYLQETGGAFKLVASPGSATQMTLLNSPIEVGIPTDFNPDSIAYQPNSAVSIQAYIDKSTNNMEGTGGLVYQNLATTYRPQIAAVGTDSGTLSAATAMLNTIETTLTNEGSSLRYPKSLYLAFRQGALNTLLASNSIANGPIGMNNVPYVYFTNAADSAGVHHPFMVIASYSIADKPNRLLDVSRPPGDGITGEYPTQSVTRDATLQLYLIKIPLRNYGLVSNLTDNTMPSTLNSDEGGTAANTVYNYASISAIGVAVDGVDIYPVLNNTLATAQNSAEITSTGIHVGRGMGLHYHADGHTAIGTDFNLYNIHDYPGQSHPPLIGFGFDGIALFGIYESSYSTMEGYNISLDEYGGHTHGNLGYHYHAHMVSKSSSAGNTYTLHILMKGAWKGQINSIPEFWDSNTKAPAYSLSQQHKYVGKP